MALANYSDLKSAIASWLVRTDLTAAIPDFITLAEARINRELRVREMIAEATGTISSGSLSVPSGFIETFVVWLDTESDTPLEYRPIEDSMWRIAGTTSGQPRWFTIDGSDFKFYPSPDGSYDYTLRYYSEVPTLSDTTTTNWLLAKAPDAYLFASLAEAYAYLLEEEREQYWSSRFEKVKRSLHAAEARSKRTSGPHRMRVVA